MAGRLGLATGAAYGATKAAIVSMTQGWTAEYGGRGIRFTTVVSGPVHTRADNRGLIDGLAETTAMSRAAEIAVVVVFLASPTVELHHRATVGVDGGRIAI